jgi:hypothetical protein
MLRQSWFRTLSPPGRFLLRIGVMRRYAEAPSTAIGRCLYALSGQTPTALGEYKLLAIHTPINHWTLSASCVRANTDQSAGICRSTERSDELLIRYPMGKIIDELMLYLAEATNE